jgi:glycosyltransferase involved in cell wall biosynthesis
MPKVSINILTKNRAELLQRALASVERQSFRDYEVVIVDDCSTDNTNAFLDGLDSKAYSIIRQSVEKGITVNRQMALNSSKGEYIAILDDDDIWVDPDKLKKQVDFLDANKSYVLIGGGIEVVGPGNQKKTRIRSETDSQIRQTMLFHNNFFTSTVMFKKNAAILAGGFISDGIDLAEDYDLWLRLGERGKMHNFQNILASYTLRPLDKLKFRLFLSKQQVLVKRHGRYYSHCLVAEFMLKIRLLLGI